MVLGKDFDLCPALTYARRYSLATLVGLVVEDDDGVAACDLPKKSRAKAPQHTHAESPDLASSQASKGPQYNHVEVPDSASSQTSKSPQYTHTGGADLASSQAPKTPKNQPLKSDNELLKKLPHFDGINYQLITVPDGQRCVIATGQTSAKKDLLSKSGFRWNPDRKIWWKFAA